VSTESNSLIFDKYFQVLPLVKELIRTGVTMAVCDRDKYIFSLISSEIDTGVNIQGVQADSKYNQLELSRIGEMTAQVAEAVNHVAETMQVIGTMAVKLDHIAERLNNK